MPGQTEEVSDFDFCIADGQVVDAVPPSGFSSILGQVFQEEDASFHIGWIFTPDQTPGVFELDDVSDCALS